MATQVGMGFSKTLLLVGAGFTGSIFVQNGRLSEILGDLQVVVKGLEKAGDSSSTDDIALQINPLCEPNKYVANTVKDFLTFYDPNPNANTELACSGPKLFMVGDICYRVHRLAMEVRQIASSRQVTILNEDSSGKGNIISLAMPAAALGALGYGYMWWKGLSFSDFLYVTKRSMANAVLSMSKHLEEVRAVLATTKEYLTMRIKNLDEKLDDQQKLSKLIKDEVTDARVELSHMDSNLASVLGIVSDLDRKMDILGKNQNDANTGLWYLCSSVGGHDKRIAKFLQGMDKPSKKALGLLELTEDTSLKDIKLIGDTITSGEYKRLTFNAFMKTNSDKNLIESLRTLARDGSIIC